MVERNVSFLKKLELNYDIFEAFKGSIDISYFPPFFKKMVANVLCERTDLYEEKCKRKNVSPEDIKNVFLKKDISGNLFMYIVGADDSTNLVIRKDDSKFTDYKKIGAVKIMEAEFSNLGDIKQFEMLEQSNLPKRFIKETIPNFNPMSEFGIRNVIAYTRYMNHELKLQETIVLNYSTDEQYSQRNSGSRSTCIGDPYTRKNDIIDTNDRYSVLRSYQPIFTIEAKNVSRDIKSTVFVYDFDNYYVAFDEPEKGDSFSKVFFIEGNKDKEEIIKEIREKLSYSEERITTDPLIIRSCHSTLGRFKGNLDYLLLKKSDTVANSFKENVKKALKHFYKNSVHR